MQLYLAVILAIVTNIIGIATTYFAMRARNVGNIILVIDPEDGQKYSYLEITPDGLNHLERGERIILNVVRITPDQSKYAKQAASFMKQAN